METRLLKEAQDTYMPWVDSESGFANETSFVSKADSACKDKIRRTMMKMLDESKAVNNARSVQLYWLINFAENVRTLWFLRPEWMATLAAVQGEKEAALKVQALNPLFHKVIPESLIARESRFT
jgi:hypothetical protein